MRYPQSQAPDEQEGAWWDAHGDILGLDAREIAGDVAQDEAAIAAAPALATGCDSKGLYFFMAQQGTQCNQCKREILESHEFSSTCWSPATAFRFPVCATCRAIKPRGRRAA